MSITELIAEAEQDEETIHKVSKRRIHRRLITYRVYLQKNFKPNTVINYMSKILKIYKYADVEVPAMPPVKTHNTETYKDLPTKQEIQKAIEYSRTKMKAIITFIGSTGLRRSDVANLKINDLRIATIEYHNNSNNVYDLITDLERHTNIIPVWNITSIKTHINHISFNTPESTQYILQMLKERYMKKELNMNDKLFDISAQGITKNFKNLNDRLNLGKLETRVKFHPHALRKFYATTLTSNDISYLDTQFLLGHTLNKVDSSYYFINAEKLKNRYTHIIKHLTFMQDVSYINISDDDKIELEELKRFKLESTKRINQLEEMINYLSRS